MLRDHLIKIGLFRATIVITGIFCLSSVFLYLLLALFPGGYSMTGVWFSLMISAIIAPVLAFYFYKIILALKESEAALAKSEDRYRSILDNIEDAYYEVDAEGNFVFFNDALCKILGYPRAELLQMNHRQLIDNSKFDEVFKIFNRVFTTGEPSSGFDWEIIKSNGEKCHIDASVSLVRDGTGKPIGFRGIIRDITERRNSENAIKESEEKYRHLLNHAPSGIYEIDFVKGKLTSVNDVLCDYSGYSREELLNMSVYDFLTEDSQKAFMERLEKLFNEEKVPDLVEYEILTKQGKKFWALLNARYHYENGVPRGATVVIHNIDEQKKQEMEKRRLEEQLRQAQKMEAIGTLAGGIAHDFNNILSAIMGYTEIAMLRVKADEKLRQHLDKIIMACERARGMVSQILAFSRQSNYKKKPIQIGQVVKEAGKLLKASLPSTIKIHMDVDPSSGIIDADDIQIHQIVMNLCTNAAHAMKDNGGTLEIQVRNVELSADEVLPYPEINPGSFVKLSISDSGTGISSETMTRMFDPYFSTKPKGEGTGLGLSIVRNLVKSHNGFLTVDSQFGKGTAFHVLLPRSEEQYIPVKKVSADVPSGNETILFVDDEQALVDVGKQMLEYLGYSVTVYTSSVAALEAFQSDPGKFDLVITDMTMPEMTGDNLSRQILELKPDIPIIICTGHSDNLNEDRARELGITSFILKPYLIQDLAKIVRNVLDEQPGDSSQ